MHKHTCVREHTYTHTQSLEGRGRSQCSVLAGSGIGGHVGDMQQKQTDAENARASVGMHAGKCAHVHVLRQN